MEKEKDKYTSKEHGIIHCPYCRGVIFRDYKRDADKDEVSLRSRCPHCKKNVTIFIKIKDRIIIQKEDGLTIKRVEKKS